MTMQRPSRHLHSLAASGFVSLACLFGLAACGGGGDTPSPASPSVSAATDTGAGGQSMPDTPTPAQATDAVGAPLSQSGSGTSVTPTIASSPDNSVDVIVDGGLPAVNGTQPLKINAPYVSVTICEPGSKTACQTIDHVLLDTGSVGLRLFADTLTSQAAPPTMGVPATSEHVRACYNYVSGYTWGSMAQVDLTFGNAKINNFPIMLVGDPRAGAAPATCAQGRNLSSGLVQGMKGVMGIGHAAVDCGKRCETAAQSLYYACAAGSTNCRRLAVPMNEQIANPVHAAGADINGVALQFPPVAGNTKAVRGKMYFGIGTHANNTPQATNQIYKLDSTGFFKATIGGRVYNRSTIDSGSNGMFYPSSLPRCKNLPAFYCPPSDTTETAAVTGHNGTSSNVMFLISNAETSVASGHPVLPGIAANLSAPSDPDPFVLWGLPFHFGRTTFLLYDGAQYGGVTGPAAIF